MAIANTPSLNASTRAVADMLLIVVQSGVRSRHPI